MKQFLEMFAHPLLKWSLLAGLITGILCFFYFLALYFIGITPLGNHKVPDFGIHIIMMVATVWYYRKRVGQGLLHLWEGLTICYVVNTVGAIITGWLIYFFVEYIDPSVFTNYLAEMAALLTSTKSQLVEKLGEAEYAVLLQSIKTTRPGDLITDELSKKTVLAVLPVLIISLIFRRQDISAPNQK
ncbi:DUF4199 domain-containing protein [Tellurirhabdus bombi]|uniref:DUF4199 domain-containing protein n=1 Tax=Tellurirhabdus bombi TaxID=2907205 RepID=UPI001F405B9D|nr:DUF4199 domain-containing protein [Tellurirhabdus bombi]